MAKDDETTNDKNCNGSRRRRGQLPSHLHISSPPPSGFVLSAAAVCVWLAVARKQCDRIPHCMHGMPGITMHIHIGNRRKVSSVVSSNSLLLCVVAYWICVAQSDLRQASTWHEVRRSRRKPTVDRRLLRKRQYQNLHPNHNPAKEEKLLRSISNPSRRTRRVTTRATMRTSSRCKRRANITTRTMRTSKQHST